MNFKHFEFDLTKDNVLVVTLGQQSNVYIMNDSNYIGYRNKQKFDYHGGLYTKSPSRISSPGAGHWHVVVDLGGGAGNIDVSVKIE